MKIKIDGKKTPCSLVKYLGIYIDEHLNWNTHLAGLKPKLSRAVGMLSKLRYFVNKETLRMVYFGIFPLFFPTELKFGGNTILYRINSKFYKIKLLELCISNPREHKYLLF